MKRKEKGGGGASKAYVLFKGGRRLKSKHGNRGRGGQNFWRTYFMDDPKGYAQSILR